ncbi:hypothetical protein [Nonomuraea composti]|uniref:hypothetical protein n=1 Tax=Nonomuraea composti TaxID=2720023 RepID=UPI0019802358|nr:hypothetical protein [Nonomuraea sp. FMUSA5-5]
MAKQGALDALAGASTSGHPGESPEVVELEAARREIERLRAMVTEQAVALHLHQENRFGVERRPKGLVEVQIMMLRSLPMPEVLRLDSGNARETADPLDLVPEHFGAGRFRAGPPPSAPASPTGSDSS